MPVADKEFVQKRITELQMKKEISESQLSYDLGHSRNYIQGISSGKALPSISEFLKICEYFEITPAEFFDPDLKDPALIRKLLQKAKKLQEKDIILLTEFIERLLQQEK